MNRPLNRLSRRSFSVGALAGLGALTVPSLTACSGPGGAGTGPLRAASTGQSFPNSYREGDRLVGFDVEVIETLAGNLGREIVWTNADFAGIMGQLEGRRIDTVANNVAVTKQRRERYDFSAPYAYAGAAIVALDSNMEVNALEDLANRTIGGVLGSNNVNHLNAWSEKNKVPVQVRTYETRDGAMQDLLAGRLDGYINSNGVLLAEIKKAQLPVKFVGEPIAWESVGFPVQKGSTLGSQLTEQIESIRSAGKLTELSQKYFDADITARPQGYTEA